MGRVLRKLGSITAVCAFALPVAFAFGAGCSGRFVGPVGYEYFATPDRDDPWSRKIRFWQARESAERRGDAVTGPAAVAGPGAGDSESAGVESLAAKYKSYRAEHKRKMARDLATWIQQQARQHYIPDGSVDEWATLEETLRNNGDDCDGLELLAFNFLRDLGFAESEVYRAIVYRRSDQQHHMVTLWFEDPDDPWVIDPTGAMTSGMPRMSELSDWTPLKVFSHDEDFTVRIEHLANTTP